MKANHSRQGRNARRRLIAMLVVVASLTFAARGVAQERIDPMAATVAQWFTMIERSFVSLADAMPTEKYGFQPTNGEFKDVRAFGEQVKHVACSNFGFFNEIEKKEPPSGCATGGPSPATTKAELMTYLRESFDYAQSVLRRMTPANALEPASGPYGRDEDHHYASPSLPSGVAGISLTFLYGIALGVLADQARGTLGSWAAHFVADVVVFVVMVGWM